MWGCIQDGVQVGMAERRRAGELLLSLRVRLRAELTAEGMDPDAACAPEDDSLADCDAIPETGCGGTEDLLASSARSLGV